jgi:ADP-ribosyl-[dinitrogen reductase] hydrolase
MTSQTVLLAEALLDSPHLTVPDLARRLLAWAESNGRGMGSLTAGVLGALTRGVPFEKAAEYVWRLRDSNAAGNGAVMRCSPIALRWWADPVRLVGETYTSAVFSHFDPRCCWSAVAVAVAIASVLRGRSLAMADLADALDADGAPDSVVDTVRQVEGACLDDFDLDDSKSRGYTLKTMQVGLWCLGCADFEESLIGVVGAAGDADTNGAVAGAVLGARFGVEAIPRRWLEAIHKPEGLVSLADALLEDAI